MGGEGGPCGWLIYPYDALGWAVYGFDNRVAIVSISPLGMLV